MRYVRCHKMRPSGLEAARRGTPDLRLLAHTPDAVGTVSTLGEEGTMKDVMQRFWNDESGQGLTEYALVLALVSIGLIAVLVLFRDAIGKVFNRVVDVLDSAPEGGYQP